MRTLNKTISAFTVNRQCIGIALAIVGVPLGMYTNFLLPIIKWSPIFMILSVLCIVSYKNLGNFRLPLFNNYFLIIIIFQIIMITYGAFSNKMSSQYLSFHIYIICLCLSLCTIEISFLKFYKNILLFTFVLSAITVLLGAYYIFIGYVVGQNAWEMRQDNEEWALEPFTIASGAIINFISFLCLKTKNRYKLFLLPLLILDFYILFSASKRTPVFVMLISVVLWSYLKGFFTRKRISILLKWLFILILIVFLAYFMIPWVKDSVDNFAYNFYAGVLNLFGSTEIKDSTGSALERVKSRDWAYSYMNTNFDLLNYIFGAGYMTRWLDNPILQSYLDMGILGFIGYFGLVLYFPIYYIIKAKSKNNFYLWSLLVCLYNIVSVLNSGHPYGYSKYTPICILALVIGLFSKYNLNSQKIIR